MPHLGSPEPIFDSIVGCGTVRKNSNKAHLKRWDILIKHTKEPSLYPTLFYHFSYLGSGNILNGLK